MNHGKIILYHTDDGQAALSLYARDGSVWMNQAQLAELFATSVPNISMHISNVLQENELSSFSVVKNYLTTAADGKDYSVTFYSLEMILAIGYRVRSPRGTQFRQWATRHLREFLIKGFVMDDERLKNPDGRPDYFDESEPRTSLRSLRELDPLPISRHFQAWRRSGLGGKGRPRRSRSCPACRPACTSACRASPSPRSCTRQRGSTRRGCSPRRSDRYPGSRRAPGAPARGHRRPTRPRPGPRCRVPGARPRTSTSRRRRARRERKTPQELVQREGSRRDHGPTGTPRKGARLRLLRGRAPRGSSPGCRP